LEKRVAFLLKRGIFLQTFLVLLILIMQNGTEKGAVHSTESRFQGVFKYPSLKEE
jgi:hypothetical protein